MIEQLQKVLDKAVQENLVAGANFLVEKDGKELVYCQAGLADREAGKPIERDSIFRLYSQSKPVTAAAAMLLMERGELDLFQPVSDFLPVYHKLTVQKPDGTIEKAGQPLLVWHLLNMTSGLVYPGDGDEAGRWSAKIFDEACLRLRTDNEMSTRELADRLAEGPLLFEPGSSWAYGTSADVLGAVIEVITGKRLAEFMEDELFKPLGMKDTAFYVPDEKRNRLCKVYETVRDEENNTDMCLYTGDNLAINNAMDREPGYAAGGAGLASTLDDYMKFARMLLQGGYYEGKQILKPRTVQYMTSGQLMPHTQGAFNNWVGLYGHSYGNLMRVCKNPSQTGLLTGAGEYGWDGWLGMYFANLPEENMTILMGTQKRDAGTFELTRKMRNVLLSHLDV